MIVETFMLIAGALIVIASLVLLLFITKGYKNEIELKKLGYSYYQDNERAMALLDETILRLKNKYKTAVYFLISASVFGVTTFAMNFIRVFASEPHSELILYLNMIQVLSMISSAIFITIINYKRSRFE